MKDTTGANLESIVDAEIVPIDEELTGKGISEFKSRMSGAIEAGHRQIILDCKKLKILNSEGLEALLWSIEEVQNAGGLVKLASLGRNPTKVFEVTQFDRIFEIYDDVIAALKSF
jgi:anti-anti-sigma factor